MLAKVLAVLVGGVTAALLFPIGGVSGCPGGPTGDDCVSWSDSVLVRYPGENGAVGMAIALVAGIAAALLVYFLTHRLVGQRRTSSES
jgi:hypothetical protein